jgi:hypothetical protein
MSNSPQSLDDVFAGVEEPEAVEAPIEEPEAVEEPDTTAEQETQESEKEPEPEAPAASKEPENESWTKAAVLDERRKRQALEAELEQLRSTKQEPEKAPDVFEDQDKFTDYLSNQVSQQVSQVRIEMSQEMMRMHDSEYDQKEVEFVEMAKENPQLAQQLSQHSMPAKFVVDTVNKARELKKLDNIDDYKAQLRAEVEAEIREKMKAELTQQQEQDDKVASIKPSLANARASKDQGEPSKQSLDDLFGR